MLTAAGVPIGGLATRDDVFDQVSSDVALDLVHCGLIADIVDSTGCKRHEAVNELAKVVRRNIADAAKAKDENIVDEEALLRRNVVALEQFRKRR